MLRGNFLIYQQHLFLAICYDCSMKTRYTTTVLGFGNHAAIEIPEKNLDELGAGRRPPVIVNLPGYSFRSTGAGMDGKVLIPFATAHREASGFWAGDTVEVELVLETGPRPVDAPKELATALKSTGLTEIFEAKNYSTRKAYALAVTGAKTEETKMRRIEKIITELKL